MLTAVVSYWSTIWELTIFLTFISVYKNKDQFACARDSINVVLFVWCKIEPPPAYIMCPRPATFVAGLLLYTARTRSSVLEPDPDCAIVKE